MILRALILALSLSPLAAVAQDGAAWWAVMGEGGAEPVYNHLLAADQSTNAFNGTVTTTNVLNEVGGNWFAELNGSSDTISRADDSAFSFGNGSTDTNFTIGIRVRVDVHTGFPGLVGKSAGTGGTPEYAMLLDGGKVVMQRLDQAWVSGPTWRVGTMTDNTLASYGAGYRTIVYTFSPPNTNKIYIDGLEVAVTVSTGGNYVAMPNGPDAFAIGVQTGSVFLDGSVDWVQVWRSTLSSNEVFTGSSTEVWPTADVVDYPMIPVEL